MREREREKLFYIEKEREIIRERKKLFNVVRENGGEMTVERKIILHREREKERNVSKQ